MENQHRKIKGYRELSQEEIDLMNEVKAKAEEVSRLINKISAINIAMADSPEHCDLVIKSDCRRWLYIAKTDLQKGFMSLTRSIAKPDFF